MAARRALVVGTIAAAVVAASAPVVRASAAATRLARSGSAEPGYTPAPYSDLFFPLALRAFARPHPTVRALASRTPTASRTPRPTHTPSLTPSPGPSPTPTRPGGIVKYPRDAGATILQIGWTDTEQPGLTWEEMNGTPWLTLYGDGRLLAGHALFDWRQPLFEGQVDDATIQEWLRRLTYDIRFFTLEPSYAHPDYSKFAIHVYVRYGTALRDFKRVSIAGFPRWLRDPLPDVQDAGVVRDVAKFVKDLEESTKAELTLPYNAEQYTALSMEVNQYLPMPPAWTHPLDIAAISDSAPLRFGAGFVHGPPGHKLVGPDEGRAVWDVVTIDARRDWSGLNQAAEYLFRGRRFVVGVRQEVPGESYFLPDELRAEWYRLDTPRAAVHTGRGALSRAPGRPVAGECHCGDCPGAP